MASASQPTLFNQALSKIFSSWSALQLAVEHGFGGPNSRQKANDLVNDIEHLFNSKRKMDAYDFADYLEDEVDERFSLMLEDGSVQMIANHICQIFTHLKEGRITEVEKFLQGLPNADRSRIQCTGDDDSSSDDDEGDMENSPSQPPHHHHHQQQRGAAPQSDGGGPSSEPPSSNGDGDAAMDVEEDDGWTVVKKGKGGRKT